MKKVYYFSFLIALASLTGGCRKFIDKYFPGHGGGGGAKECRITGFVASDTAYIFKYNAAGKLDSVVSQINYTNNNAHAIGLRYDAGGRLTGMTRTKREPDEVEVFHVYGYTGDRITSDSIYDFSTFTDRYWASQIEYDELGRIVKETLQIFYSDNEWETPYLEIFYVYDSNGNLMGQSSDSPIAYGNQRNPLLTDKTLQFLARDYSRNSRATATAFNGAGFPTAFSEPYPFTFYPPTGVTTSIIPVSSISYRCQ